MNVWPFSVKVSKPELSVLAAPVPNWIEALFTPSSLNTPFLVWMNIPENPVASGAWLPLESSPLVVREKTRPTSPHSQRHVHVIQPQVEAGLAEAGLVGGVGLRCAAHAAASRSADPGQRELAIPQLQVLEATARAAHVREEEIVEMDVVPPVIPVARPELQGRLRGNDVAHRTPDLGEGEVGASRTDRVLNRRVGSNGGLKPADRSAAGRDLTRGVVNLKGIFTIEILAESDFPIGIRLIAEAILGTRARRLESDHRAAAAVPAIAGAKIPMDVHESLQHLLNPAGIGMVCSEQALLTRFGVALVFLFHQDPRSVRGSQRFGDTRRARWSCGGRSFSRGDDAAVSRARMRSSRARMRSACLDLCFQSLQFRAQFIRLGGDCRRVGHGESRDQTEEHGTGLRCPSDTPGCKAWKHGSEVSRCGFGQEGRFGRTRERRQSSTSRASHQSGASRVVGVQCRSRRSDLA